MADFTIYDRNDNEVALPTVRAVCDACNGDGVHVAPGVDSHGLTGADFAEDPDFAEEYFAGRYDVTCQTCKGRNVIDVIDWDGMDDELREDAETHYRCEAMCREEERAEARAFGYR